MGVKSKKFICCAFVVLQHLNLTLCSCAFDRNNDRFLLLSLYPDVSDVLYSYLASSICCYSILFWAASSFEPVSPGEIGSWEAKKLRSWGVGHLVRDWTSGWLAYQVAGALWLFPNRLSKCQSALFDWLLRAPFSPLYHLHFHPLSETFSWSLAKILVCIYWRRKFNFQFK